MPDIQRYMNTTSKYLTLWQTVIFSKSICEWMSWRIFGDKIGLLLMDGCLLLLLHPPMVLFFSTKKFKMSNPITSKLSSKFLCPKRKFSKSRCEKICVTSKMLMNQQMMDGRATYDTHFFPFYAQTKLIFCLMVVLLWDLSHPHFSEVWQKLGATDQSSKY